eukprot:CAMPEP_0173435248 /NCGR_PEP_ID=MMETSP1357-20121228/14579_1 /TAXON_ID=77926 /ORGANISM="Hemiselmis rufescens, Strain PCC563" /LENGTH=178 /DNA_ID=CAMNT_0014400207 /DNA_START=359 /DNA_END=892 /DNA_ORIENTATION=+
MLYGRHGCWLGWPGILRVSFRAGRFVSGMCMSFAQEPGGQITTEKLHRELLASFQVKEEVGQKLLREMEEASKKLEEVWQKLLQTQEEALQSERIRVLELKEEILLMTSKAEAVLANPFVLSELNADWYATQSENSRGTNTEQCEMPMLVLRHRMTVTDTEEALCPTWGMQSKHSEWQ